jgi:hypothetical protein
MSVSIFVWIETWENDSRNFIQKGHLSTVQKLVTSQKNGDDYETDFDESNDDDDDDGRRPLNSRYVSFVFPPIFIYILR